MMSDVISSFSGATQINLSLLQPRTATQFGSRAKKPVFSVGFRSRPNAAAVSWSAPAMESMYETLGISENGTLPEIKRAYKQLARQFHPDVSRDPERVEELTRRFIQIQEAYETLSDPKTRALYDRDMAAKGLHLAFGLGCRKRPSYCSGFGLGMEERGEWKERWRIQVEGLARQSMRKNTWGGRMRCHSNSDEEAK